MASKFTDARNAVWAAIDNWAALNPGGRSVFNRKITHGTNTANLENDVAPGLSDQIAIEIVPVNANPKWQTNRMQECSYFLGVKLVGQVLERLEQVVEDIWQGVYEAKAGGTELSYVRTATGYHPQSLGITWTRTQSGNEQRKIRVWQATLSIGLRFNKDPLGRS
jgi:hypothetical protein